VDGEEPSPPPTDTSIPVTGKPAPPQAKAPTAAVARGPRRPGKRNTGPITLPPPDVTVMIIRSTLAALNHANFTENYAVLHGLATPSLQKRYTPHVLGKAFAALRKQKVDLSLALVVAPTWSEAPHVTPAGDLRVAGHFPVQPRPIKFSLVYHPIDGIWMVDELSVTVAPPPTVTSQTGGGPPPLPQGGVAKK
jgi:hypothetical protein